MEALFILELLILLCMAYIRVSLCFNITIVLFRKVRDHPHLDLCARALLHETNFVGLRVHNVTGVCEFLPRDWDFKQTMGEQYSYVKRIYTQEYLDPPISYLSISWLLPGLFRNGAMLEVTGRMPNGTAKVYYRLLDEAKLNSRMTLLFHVGLVRIMYEYNDTTLHSLPIGETKVLSTINNNTFRLTFVAEKPFIRLFLNGQELLPKNVPDLPLTATTYFQTILNLPGPVPAFSMLKFVNEDE